MEKDRPARQTENGGWAGVWTERERCSRKEDRTRGRVPVHVAPGVGLNHGYRPGKMLPRSCPKMPSEGRTQMQQAQTALSGSFHEKSSGLVAGRG